MYRINKKEHYTLTTWHGIKQKTELILHLKTSGRDIKV